MSLESRLEELRYKANNYVFYKLFIPSLKLKELIDTREIKIRLIAYSFSSIEFEEEFSIICKEFDESVLNYSSPEHRLNRNFKSPPFNISGSKDLFNEFEKTRSLTSKLLIKNDDNSELNMNNYLRYSSVKAFENPFPPKVYTQEKSSEKKVPQTPNKLSFLDSIFKFIFLIILILAGLGSIALFFLKLGFTSGW